MGVGVAGVCENKANSAEFQVKLPAGAELGNIKYKYNITETICHV